MMIFCNFISNDKLLKKVQTFFQQLQYMNYRQLGNDLINLQLKIQ